MDACVDAWHRRTKTILGAAFLRLLNFRAFRMTTSIKGGKT